MKMYLCAVNNIVAYGGNRLTGVTEAAADYITGGQTPCDITFAFAQLLNSLNFCTPST